MEQKMQAEDSFKLIVRLNYFRPFWLMSDVQKKIISTFHGLFIRRVVIEALTSIPPHMHFMSEFQNF